MKNKIFYDNKMLNFSENIEMYYKNYIKDILYKIVKEEHEYKQDLVNIDEEGGRFLLVTNGNKYYIWISKLENKFLNKEDTRDSNKALVFIFNKELQDEQWIIVPDNIINWEYSEEYLLEGYLYDNEMYFSDILYPNFNRGYIYRRSIFKKIIREQTSKNMIYIREQRGEKDIVLGKLINMIELKEEGVDETMKRILLKNFKYKTSEITEEIVNGRELIKNTIRKEKTEEKIEEKEIEMGNKIEIYNVYNIDTKNNEGLLLVKTLKQSIMLRELFNNKIKRVKIKCKYDIKKKKWTLE